MATKPKAEQQLKEALAENKRLKRENEDMKKQISRSKSADKHFTRGILRTVGTVFFIGLAVALLMVGNILFWAGNTMVKNDRFDAATQGIIKDPVIQQAVATYTTQQIFSNVDAQATITEVLPPRADFLAPTLASQLQNGTQKVLQTTLAKPSFQDRWNKSLSESHARFIDAVSKYGGDGKISLNEIYQQLSASLGSTKLSFLANKQLPSKVGSITVFQGEQISIAHRVITKIDTWRLMALVLFVLSAAAGVWLSVKRRRAIIILALTSAAVMFLTLVSLRVTREMIAGQVVSQYSEAVRHVAQIIFHGLVVQTATILGAFLVVAGVAWLSGPSRGAQLVKTRSNQLLNGKLHTALFGGHENGLTLWIGRNRRFLQWTALTVVAIVTLLVRLTPAVLLTSTLVLLGIVIVVEILAAPPQTGPSKRLKNARQKS